MRVCKRSTIGSTRDSNRVHDHMERNVMQTCPLAQIQQCGRACSVTACYQRVITHLVQLPPKKTLSANDPFLHRLDFIKAVFPFFVTPKLSIAATESQINTCYSIRALPFFSLFFPHLFFIDNKHHRRHTECCQAIILWLIKNLFMQRLIS